MSALRDWRYQNDIQNAIIHLRTQQKYVGTFDLKKEADIPNFKKRVKYMIQEGMISRVPGKGYTINKNWWVKKVK